MKFALAGLALIASIVGAAADPPHPTTGRLGVEPLTNPQNVYVAMNGGWSLMGSVDPGTNVFTPVAGGGGGGGCVANLCDMNMLQWNGVGGLASPTTLGSVPPSGLLPNVNAYILNTSLTVTATITGSLPLPTGAATAANQTTANGSLASILAAIGTTNTTLSSILANQTNNTQKALISCLDGTTTCTGSGGGGGGGSGSTPQGTTQKAINVTTAATSVVIPNVASNYTYINYFDFMAAGTTNVTLEYGTGTLCGTGTTVIGGPYALTAQAGKTGGAGLGAIATVPIGNDVCLINGSGVQVGGMITYTQSTTASTSFGGGGGGGGGGSNASVGVTGAAVPTSATLAGLKDAGGLLQPLGPANPLPVSVPNPALGTINAAPPASGVYMGVQANGGMVGIVQAAASVPIALSASGVTQLVPAVSLKVIMVTHWNAIAAGTTNLTFEYGTGTNCAVGTQLLTGAYPLTAQAGAAPGGGLGPILVIPAGNALCVANSAAIAVGGSLSYSQF